MGETWSWCSWPISHRSAGSVFGGHRPFGPRRFVRADAAGQRVQCSANPGPGLGRAGQGAEHRPAAAPGPGRAGRAPCGSGRGGFSRGGFCRGGQETDVRRRTVVLRAGGLAPDLDARTGWFGRVGAMTAGVVAAAGVVVVAAAWSIAGSVGDTPPHPLWIAPPAAVADVRESPATGSTSPSAATRRRSTLHRRQRLPMPFRPAPCRQRRPPHRPPGTTTPAPEAARAGRGPAGRAPVRVLRVRGRAGMTARARARVRAVCRRSGGRRQRSRWRQRRSELRRRAGDRRRRVRWSGSGGSGSGGGGSDGDWNGRVGDWSGRVGDWSGRVGDWSGRVNLGLGRVSRWGRRPGRPRAGEARVRSSSGTTARRARAG